MAGEDINFGTISFTGAGVKVAVVDTGLEIAHEDLCPNVVPGGSKNYVPPGGTDPTNPATTGDHGTSVAGLIAARGNNSIGLQGVAGQAPLVGFNFLRSPSFANNVDALGGALYSDSVFVFNQSYGTSNTDDFLIDPSVEAQYASGVTTLRGGKGAIYVKSAGNGFNGFGNAVCDQAWSANPIGVTCQNANMDPTNTLPYNIVVGAVNAAGIRASYSTAGSAIWVSAPGGEFGAALSFVGPGFPSEVYQPAMVTTDQSGCDKGYSRTGLAPAPNDFQDGHPENPNCNYTSTFNGTSSAAPVTSGVVALVLEANPALTWRDVKHILAVTAEKIDPTRAPVTVTLGAGPPYEAERPWITNAAGFPFHNWYGFGRVDATAAVALAQSYPADSWGALIDTGIISTLALNLPIFDNNSDGASNSLMVTTSPTIIFIEAVQITVNLTHAFTGDLGIELTSPSGTRSILFNIRNGFGASDNLTGMVLLSNAFYGENPNGDWTIEVVDGFAGDMGFLGNWKIRIYGH